MGRQRGESTNVLYRDYKIIFRSGVELEITNCRNDGLAHLLAVDYMRNTSREAVIVKCEQLPVDRLRHEERLKKS